MSIESVLPSHRLILCRLLLLLTSIFPSVRVFSDEPAFLIKWPKYWSFSISPSNKYSELLSFRIGCFDILAVRGILKCLLQHHKPKASILCHSAFLIIEPTHLYMTTEKAIVLNIWAFVGKVMSLLYKMLSRFDMGFSGGSEVKNLPAWVYL